jgi:hypothetical protein
MATVRLKPSSALMSANDWRPAVFGRRVGTERSEACIRGRWKLAMARPRRLDYRMTLALWGHKPVQMAG